MVSAPVAATACSNAGPGRLCGHAVEGRDLVEIRAVAARQQFGLAQVERGERLGERRRVGDEDQAGREQAGDVPELGVVLALQRIGDRDRRHRDAGGVAGEREQRVVDAVAGKDHHRPLGREAAFDQALRQRVDLPPRRLVAELAPAAVGGALGQKQAARIALDRRTEQARQAWIVRRQRLGRAIAQAAVGAALADDLRARIGDRAQRRRCGHLGFLRACPRTGARLDGVSLGRAREVPAADLMHHNPQWQGRGGPPLRADSIGTSWQIQIRLCPKSSSPPRCW